MRCANVNDKAKSSPETGVHVEKLSPCGCVVEEVAVVVLLLVSGTTKDVHISSKSEAPKPVNRGLCVSCLPANVNGRSNRCSAMATVPDLLLFIFSSSLLPELHHITHGDAVFCTMSAVASSEEPETCTVAQRNTGEKL